MTEGGEHYIIKIRNRILRGDNMYHLRELCRRLNLALYSSDYAYTLNEQRHGIKTSEMCLLYALDDGELHSQSDICMKWEIPRSTLNTIIKQWERRGYLKLSPIPGKSREMHISLTDEGRLYAADFLESVYSAEDEAMQKTVEKYSESFVEAMEYFDRAITEAFERQISEKENKDNE